MPDILTFIVSRMNYFIYVILMMLGIYGVFVKKNYIKKIIGLNILQSSIILFFISIGAKNNATIPILEHHAGPGSHAAVHAMDYMNPLPHVLMLTAIVVAVATLGVALAMVIKIYKAFNTIEEDQVIAGFTKEQDD